MAAITPTHYLPGYTITLPLSAGSTYDFDNYAVRTLPDGGDDPGRNGGNTVIGYNTLTFNILGEGRTVYFTISCPDGGDASMALYVRNDSGGHTTWDAVVSDSPVFGAPVEISYLLTSGTQYYLDVGAGSYWSGAPNGHPFDRLFHLEASYTTGGAADSGSGGAAPANDKRENAITIPIAGATRYWISTDVDITHATRDTGDYGDPWSLTYDQSVWWKWTADVTGTCTLITYDEGVAPESAAYFNVQILDRSANDSLVHQNHITETVEFNVVKGHIYYFCLGVTGFNAYHDVSVSMSLKAPALPGPKKPVKAKPAGSSSVLELVREFQRETGYVVRFIDDHTIEIVYPSEGLPTDFIQARAEEYYVETESTTTSSLEALRLNKSDTEFSGHVRFYDNDISLFTSGWKIAGKIPFPENGGVPVSGMTAEFTAQRCTVECELFADDDAIDPSIRKQASSIADAETEPS